MNSHPKKTEDDKLDCPNCVVLRQKNAALKELLKTMEQQAHHDVLTGLPNRRYFVEALNHRIMRCQRYGDTSALLFLDVDNLKSANDEHGHAVGDALLRDLARILKQNTRVSDVVARIGGDEFAMLLDNLDADEVDVKIKYLNDRIASTKIEAENDHVSLGAAIGYCFVGPQDTVSALMSRADAAMYKEKHKTG